MLLNRITLIFLFFLISLIKNVGLNLEVITNRSPEYFPFTVKLLRNFEKYLYKNLKSPTTATAFSLIKQS